MGDCDDLARVTIWPGELGECSQSGFGQFFLDDGGEIGSQGAQFFGRQGGFDGEFEHLSGDEGGSVHDAHGEAASFLAVEECGFPGDVVCRYSVVAVNRFVQQEMEIDLAEWVMTSPEAGPVGEARGPIHGVETREPAQRGGVQNGAGIAAGVRVARGAVGDVSDAAGLFEPLLGSCRGGVGHRTQVDCFVIVGESFKCDPGLVGPQDVALAGCRTFKVNAVFGIDLQVGKLLGSSAKTGNRLGGFG